MSAAPASELRARAQAAAAASTPAPARRRSTRPANRADTYATFDVLPPFQRDNKYIHKYYRTGYTVRRSLRSLFQLHNETGNIWSHLIGKHASRNARRRPRVFCPRTTVANGWQALEGRQGASAEGGRRGMRRAAERELGGGEETRRWPKHQRGDWGEIRVGLRVRTTRMRAELVTRAGAGRRRGGGERRGVG